MAIYNFRIDKSQKKFIRETLREEQNLRQGWGRHNMAEMSAGDFKKRTTKHYKHKTTRIATNLLHMRSFKKGDWLVTPHFPEYGRVSIHEVAEDCDIGGKGYSHEENAIGGLGHKIKIKKSHGMEENSDISIRHHELSAWYGKLRWMRLPVLRLKGAKEACIRRVIERLGNGDAAQFKKSSLEDFNEAVREDIMTLCHAKLRDMPANGSSISFERICEHVLHQHGYKLERRNQYDGQGGDADLVCVKDENISHASVGIGDLTDQRLLVQIKKHEGTTSAEAVEQLRRIKETSYRDSTDTDLLVISLASKFSKAAEEAATDHDVQLMNGEALMALYITGLMNSLDDEDVEEA